MEGKPAYAINLQGLRRTEGKPTLTSAPTHAMSPVAAATPTVELTQLVEAVRLRAPPTVEPTLLVEAALQKLLMPWLKWRLSPQHCLAFFSRRAAAVRENGS